MDQLGTRSLPLSELDLMESVFELTTAAVQIGPRRLAQLNKLQAKRITVSWELRRNNVLCMMAI